MKKLMISLICFFKGCKLEEVPIFEERGYFPVKRCKRCGDGEQDGPYEERGCSTKYIPSIELDECISQLEADPYLVVGWAEAKNNFLFN